MLLLPWWGGRHLDDDAVACKNGGSERVEDVVEGIVPGHYGSHLTNPHTLLFHPTKRNQQLTNHHNRNPHLQMSLSSVRYVRTQAKPLGHCQGGRKKPIHIKPIHMKPTSVGTPRVRRNRTALLAMHDQNLTGFARVRKLHQEARGLDTGRMTVMSCCHLIV